MPLVTLKELLTDATQKKYGVPCLLGGNLEMVLGPIKAAEEVGADDQAGGPDADAEALLEREERGSVERERHPDQPERQGAG